KRCANPWNAFVRQKLNDENEGRALGDRLKLPAFIKANRTQLVSSYLRLTLADKNRLRENVNELCMSHVKVTCANPKALQKDVNATFKTMQTEVLVSNNTHICHLLVVKQWTSIQARTGLEGMYIAVQGDVEQYHEPKLFYTAKVRSFIKDVLGMEPKRFALKVESWVVGNFGKQRTYNKHDLLNFHVDNIILPTLSHPPKKKVKMNYSNYEGKIVETYGIAL
ncbi:hypothetical protein F4604DRAFT_1529405, partial [Suillus subluteus]